jgi:hypothetical protein
LTCRFWADEKDYREEDSEGQGDLARGLIVRPLCELMDSKGVRDAGGPRLFAIRLFAAATGTQSAIMAAPVPPGDSPPGGVMGTSKKPAPAKTSKNLPPKKMKDLPTPEKADEAVKGGISRRIQDSED